MQLEVIEPEKKAPRFTKDPLFSVIIPIHDVEPSVLKRCLRSVDEQDYVNREVICVLNGEFEGKSELKNIVQSFPYFKLLEIEQANACAARNAGFKESKGEIVSFTNSDYILKPGTLRLWVDALKKNKDCGFAYGGYEYNSAQRSYFPSGPFDEWLEDVENYIDCGFPLWRKYVVEWDENCKSLQDWDFWLRVIKTHKVKGFYLGRDYSFIAELPRQKGLSHDSSSNWNDRVTWIKNKNGIETRDILVDSIGAANHGVQIAKLINGDFRQFTWHKTDWISTYKALYMIGFYIRAGEKGLNEHARRLAVFKDKNPNAKRIVHFVGADIYWLRKFPYESLKYLAGALNASCDHILSENQEAHDELLEMGIKTEIVPIPSYTKNWEVKPLPKDFSVACYLVKPGTGSGESDFDKYCYEATLSIIRALPNVQFQGYGRGAEDVKYPNLKTFPSIDREKWPEFVYNNSCLLRLSRHDHHPMASNEFIMAGRDVITNIPTLGAHMIDTSGKSELNEWDKFSEGFNTGNWPTTKLKVIQKIREIRKSNGAGIVIANAAELKKTLDQQTYIDKIKGMCYGK